MRIVFAGTPDFATPCLQTLIDGPHEIAAVYTQPDRPAGRGRKLTASPVKQCAIQHGLSVYQPTSIKTDEALDELAGMQPDLMVVVAYGLILPKAVLKIPRLGCINVHASLLPRWRGAAPIQRAIQAGDCETGVTLMQMDEGLDTGDILLASSCPINPAETSGSLHDKLAELGAELLARGVNTIQAGELRPRPQPEEGVTYAHKLSKSEAQIVWSTDAKTIEQQIRAFNPWPVAFSQLDDENVRLWEATATDEPSSQEPGVITNCSEEGIDVACGKGSVRLLRLQWPGGRALTAAEASHGRDLRGSRFG